MTLGLIVAGVVVWVAVAVILAVAVGRAASLGGGACSKCTRSGPCAECASELEEAA